VPYVDLAGVPTYYERHGSGEPVLLLHGGFCSIETWRSQIEALSPHYEVHAPERPGQGRTADRDGPIGFDQMVGDTVAYLDHAGLDSAHVVGFSDGAITGLLLAMEHPGRTRSLVSISANLDPDCFGTVSPDEAEPDGSPDAGADEVTEEDEDPEWAEIRATYDRLSPDGPEHGDVVLEKLFTLWKSQPRIDPADLARIAVPTMVLAGDGDSIPTEHTVLIARSIPGARLCVVPGAGHMVTTQRPGLVNAFLLDFLAEATR
jgi:pimeloyl-ACP methyl ester carboxylesterase